MQQNNFPPQPTNVNEIITNAAAKAMIQTGAIAKPSLFTPLSLTIASSLVAGGLVVSLHVLASLGVLNDRWKPDLRVVLPAALVGGAIVGRVAIALSSVQEIKVKPRFTTVQPLPEPASPPIPNPDWDLSPVPRSSTHEVAYQTVEELMEEDDLVAEEEGDERYYQDELEDAWADKQTVRR